MRMVAEKYDASVVARDVLLCAVVVGGMMEVETAGLPTPLDAKNGPPPPCRCGVVKSSGGGRRSK